MKDWHKPVGLGIVRICVSSVMGEGGCPSLDHNAFLTFTYSRSCFMSGKRTAGAYSQCAGCASLSGSPISSLF